MVDADALAIEVELEAALTASTMRPATDLSPEAGPPHM